MFFNVLIVGEYHFTNIIVMKVNFVILEEYADLGQRLV